MTSDQRGAFRRLRTPRLELVRTTLDHAEALFQIHGDPDSVRFLPREPCQDLVACRELLTKMISVETRGQGTRWSILREGLVIGSLGYHAWNRRLENAHLSYELIPRARGAGYAREAVAAVLEFGFADMELGRILAEAHGENQASIRLLRRFGFRQVGGYWRVWQGGEAAWFERFELAV